MVTLVPYDLTLHKSEYVQISKDYMIWVLDQLDAHFGINSRSYIDIPFDEWLDGVVDPFEKLEPPYGSLYMAIINGEVVGMGAIKKLSETIGEIKRMYNKPEYRGQGIGRKMINKLLSDGKHFGCKSFKLDTPKFSIAAQNLYKSVGFVESEKYPESEIPPFFQDYWVFMEKND